MGKKAIRTRRDNCLIDKKQTHNKGKNTLCFYRKLNNELNSQGPTRALSDETGPSERLFLTHYSLLRFSTIHMNNSDAAPALGSQQNDDSHFKCHEQEGFTMLRLGLDAQGKKDGALLCFILSVESQLIIK